MVKDNPKNFYQAIVLDIDMPIMDGLKACKLIKEYFREEEKEIDERKIVLPYIYALTSEMNQDFIKVIEGSGFKAVCKYYKSPLTHFLTMYFAV